MSDLDRIVFESTNAVERSDRVREAERTRGDKRKERPEKRKRREKRRRGRSLPGAQEKKPREETGKKLDIEA